jgi:hypothetical protein
MKEESCEGFAVAPAFHLMLSNVQKSPMGLAAARSRELLPGAGDLGIREKRKAPAQRKRPGRPK